MKTFAIIVLFLLPALASGEDFKKWFFDLHLEECEISGKILSPQDEEIGTFSGKSTGKLSPDGKRFTTSFDYVYLPRGNKESYALVWTKGNDGVFRSSSDDSAKAKHTCELVVEANRYVLKTTYPDGTIVKTEGLLGKDKVVRSDDAARNKDGDIVAKLKYTQSRIKKDTDEPED
jgi:hypothetical protein